MNPFLATDGYKVDHHRQYPKGTTLVYSNFTPRSNKYAPKGCDKIVSFGQQMVITQIQEMFKQHFFSVPKDIVCGEIKRDYSNYLNTDYDVSHIESLWDLGYLPIEVKSLPEGTRVPMGVPVLTIKNTIKQFYWLTNFLETLISNLLWKPMTSATIADQYKRNLLKWAKRTDKDNVSFVDFQGHDFSMRGMDSVDATISSGLGHAISFMGSDSLPVIHGARKYYNEKDLIAGVPATEHSVMCAGTKDGEVETFRRLLNIYKDSPILSVVSDTWNLWDVLTKILPELKEEIMSREGKLVIRPDSGNPVDIICGNRQVISDGSGGYRYSTSDSENKGVIELLWETFGGTINDQGYKVLDPHIGAIYGDSITIERAEEICSRLEQKGFASTNIVLGIGSFTYQYNTRDTFGFAMKATYVEVEEYQEETAATEAHWVTVGREIFKDPITDDGTKKSARGLLTVQKDSDSFEYKLVDMVNKSEEGDGFLLTIFKDGRFLKTTTIKEIKNNLKQQL